jgi:Zn-dependent M28 family amino/carboxypeptidase
MRKLFTLFMAAATVAAMGLTSQSAAVAASAAPNVNTSQLRGAVTAGGILSYEKALQRIATKNDDQRASGTPGFAAAARYVENTMSAAGYAVREQHFTFPYYAELGSPTLSEVSPTADAIQSTTTIDYSGDGTVTGRLVPIGDILVPLPAGGSSTSGCSTADFPPLTGTAPEIALIQRGTCAFDVKAQNAEAAGYAAAIIFNSGAPGDTGDLSATLGQAATIPVEGADSADGAALYTATQAGPVTVKVTTDTQDIAKDGTENIIAETRGGDPNHVVLVDAYLDALATGPGINEDGSGVATMLDIATQITRLHLNPRYKIEFVFFGADEVRAWRIPDTSVGLLGSQHFVDSLSTAQTGDIIANLDLDSTGSPNYVRFVSNGDGPTVNNGSLAITNLFNDYFTSQGLATEATEPPTFDGFDFGPLIDAGIPSGGLFGGAAGAKTAQEAAIYGGTVGDDYDACFHASCDTISNLNPEALVQFGDAAAAVTWTLAERGLPAN